MKKKKKRYEKRIKKLWFFFDLYKFWIMTIEKLRWQIEERTLKVSNKYSRNSTSNK